MYHYQKYVYTKRGLCFLAYSRRPSLKKKIQHKIQQLHNTLDRIRGAYLSKIERSNWIDNETKINIQTKVTNIVVTIGEPDTAEEVLTTTSVLDDFNFTSTHIIDMIMELNVVYRSQLENSSIEEMQYNMNEERSLGQIKYIPEKNTIQVPLSVLCASQYESHQMNFVKYGTLGTLIGHYISHSIYLDATLSLFSNSSIADGGVANNEEQMLWNDESRHKLNERITCLDDQFFNETNESVENFVDTIGVDVAYEAYLGWVSDNKEEEILPGLSYTPRQLFWISFAWQYCLTESANSDEAVEDNVHLINKYNSMNVLRNSLYFAVDFGCRAGSAMNPTNKCYI